MLQCAACDLKMGEGGRLGWCLIYLVFLSGAGFLR